MRRKCSPCNAVGSHPNLCFVLVCKKTKQKKKTDAVKRKKKNPFKGLSSKQWGIFASWKVPRRISWHLNITRNPVGGKKKNKQQLQNLRLTQPVERGPDETSGQDQKQDLVPGNGSLQCGSPLWGSGACYCSLLAPRPAALPSLHHFFFFCDTHLLSPGLSVRPPFFSSPFDSLSVSSW